MKSSPVFVRARLVLGLAVASLSLSGCVNVRYDDQHADRNSRMYAVALRFSRTMSTQGMFGVNADIQNCYRDTSLGVIKRFALQDCLSYDYAAYSFDKDIGRTAFRGLRTPFFEDSVAPPRMVQYGKLDGFGDPSELAAFLMTNKDMIFRDLQIIPGSIFANPSRARPRLLHGGGFL